MTQVVGRRSPRWAFWSKIMIPCENGEQYLFRLRIVQTPWFGVFLHDIYEPDGDRDPHNHPWPFLSFVVRGGYVERVYDDPVGKRRYSREAVHSRYSAHRMGRVSAHRITYIHPGTKTLILTGARHSDGWGFFKEDGSYVPWQEYEELQQAEGRGHSAKRTR